MKKAKIRIERDCPIGSVDDRLYSSFLEHLGRAVYGGIFEPNHSEADEDGFRQDVLALVRDLNLSHVRYPGGNFLSGYHWRDGVGPPETRPRRLDLAWHSVESNLVGINEFMAWCRKAGLSPMGAVNMGTGTPREAGELVEYCNYPGGTWLSDLRRKHGHETPHGIKLWCVGNEMDGPWQIGHLDADDYGKKALETAKIMRWVDDSIELVVCGSSNTSLSSYPSWDRTVLEHTYDLVDYLSVHRYYENEGNDFDFLASFVDMDKFIHTLVGTADYVRALKRGGKDIHLSFDEWNVWYQAHQTPHPWQEAPALLEDNYSLLDALVFAGMGMTLVNHADRVKIACLAQLVNVIAPIWTQNNGEAIRQTIYFPFQLLSRYGRGVVLQPVATADRQECRYGDAPLVYQTVVYTPQEDTLNVFLLCIADETMETNLDLRGFPRFQMRLHTALFGDDLHAKNTFAAPNAVTPRKMEITQGEADIFRLLLPSFSFHHVQFGV